MMKPIEDIERLIMPKCPGTAQPLLIDAVRSAAEQFCERTRLWRYRDTFQTDDGCDEILCAPQDAQIYEIESARFNGRPLIPASIHWLDDNMYDWRTRDPADKASYIAQLHPNTVVLVPRAKGELDLSLWLKPSLDAEELPDWMLNQYGRVLADGAVGELMSIPGQAYTSPQLAVAYLNRFQAKIDRLSNRNIRGQQRAPVRTKPNWF